MTDREKIQLINDVITRYYDIFSCDDDSYASVLVMTIAEIVDARFD